jgi:drug/metabolite transporter, DME family
VISRPLSNPNARRGYLLVLAATLCWSTSGTFIKLIRANYAFTAWTLAFWRDFFSFLLFLLVAAALGARLHVARRDLISLALMGAISIGIFHVLWAQAVVMIPVAVATVLNYTAPVFVVLLAWLLWQERPNRRQLMALGLAFLGCLLVTGAYDLGSAHLNWLGLLVGFATGVTYGSLSILGKNALRRYEPLTIMTYAFGFAALTILLLQPGAIWQTLTLPLEAWLAIGVLALVSTVTGFAFYTSGLQYLSASSASITATLEPVIATGLAFVLLAEVIEPIQMLGGALVIGAVVLLAVKTTAERRPQGLGNNG